MFLGLEFWKTIVIFEISTLEFVQNVFLTHAVNFGIGSYFSKGPGSIFCESSGPLYVKYAIGKAGLKTDKVKLSEDINEYYVNIIENSFGLKPSLGKLV